MAKMENYMEHIVDGMIGPILKNLKHCTCESCLMDIRAITLNSLPTKYVVTREGQVYSKLSTLQQQFDVDVITAVTKAVDIVTRNPRHGQ